MKSIWITLVIIGVTFFSCTKSIRVSDGVSIDTLKIYDSQLGVSKELIGNYYSRFGISIPKYYVVSDSLAINLNWDDLRDTLAILSPIILEDSRYGSPTNNPKRILVEIMNVDGQSKIRNLYGDLVSNVGGVLSKYNGVFLTEKGFGISHQSGSKYSWTYVTEFSTAYSDSIYLVKLQKQCSFDSVTEKEEYSFTKKSLKEIDINDSLSVNCNCDRIWAKLEKLKDE